MLDKWGIPKDKRDIPFESMLTSKGSKALVHLIETFPDWKSKGYFFSTSGIKIHTIMANFAKRIYETHESKFETYIYYTNSVNILGNYYNYNIDSITWREKLMNAKLSIIMNIGLGSKMNEEFLEDFLTRLLRIKNPFILTGRCDTAPGNMGIGFKDLLTEVCEMVHIK